MQLSYRGTAFREYRRSFRDRRVAVLAVVARYVGTDGEEYRKTFETRRNQGEPIVPLFGTHEEMAAAQYQWTAEGLSAARDLRDGRHVLV